MENDRKLLKSGSKRISVVEARKGAGSHSAKPVERSLAAPQRHALKRSTAGATQSRAKKSRKGILAVAAVALLAALGIGGTIAYFTDSTDDVTNTFTPSSVSTEVTETTSGGVKSDVAVKNTGDIDAFVRAAIQVNWADEDGNICGNHAAPVAGTDYSVAWGTATAEGSWFSCSDGYWYWSGKVAPDAETGALISSIQLAQGADVPEGYGLDVRVVASGIQAEGIGTGESDHPDAKSPVEYAWKVVQRSADGNSISSK